MTVQKINNGESLSELDKLDAGQAEVIVLAGETKAVLVIMDELLGR